jgi:prevent-host-death family protein
MSEVTVSEARESFSELLNRTSFGKERFVVVRHGKRLATITPVEDLEMPEEREGRRDVLLAERAEKRAEVKGEKPIAWKMAKKLLAK